MSEVTVVGAGLAGLVAAFNCAKAGHRVRVLERRSQVGGEAGIRPAVEVTAMDREAISRFIRIELKPPQVVPTEEFVLYIYGKRYSIPGEWLHLNSVERGARETSLDRYLYEMAVEAGVEFEFGVSLQTQEDFARLPGRGIIATGLAAEPFSALRRPALDVQGFVAKGPMQGPTKMIAFFDRHTRYYCYCANQNDVGFGLGFDMVPVSPSLRDQWKRQLEDREGWRFDQWLPHEGMVATTGINSPELFAGNKILAGTFAAIQDPFLLFGVHGSLCSGRIAAVAVDDRERAWRLFKDFTSAYRLSWSAKKIFDALPHASRKLALRSVLSLYCSHHELMQPLFESCMRTLPGYGKLK